MTGEQDRRPGWRGVTASVKGVGRRVPAVARRDAELAELRDQVQRLQRKADRRGTGPEQWTPPEIDDAVELVRASGFFDAEWYADQLDEQPSTTDDLIRHYLEHGAGVGFSPHPGFVASWYVAQVRADPGYASRKKIARAPLLHYLMVGAGRRLSPHPAFDPKAYLQDNPAARGERFGPFAHFLREGNRPAVDVDFERPIGMARWAIQRPRVASELLAYARDLGTRLRATRGYLHLERDHETFDFAAEEKLKASLLEGRADAAEQPLVSVVLPTKDRAGIIEVAVDSVLEQTYANFELILVDDGSSDGTAESLGDRLSDPRVVYVRHDEPRGVAAARNAALRRARGELIAYLDSDNTWRPDFLELMVAFMVRGEHRVGYAMSALTEEGGQGRRLYRGMPFSREALRERNYIDCIVLVHERSLLDETGLFDEELKRNVDWELFIRMAEATDFAFLPVIATEYDVWETRGDRITTEVPPSYRQLVRQRALLDWDEVGAALVDRDDSLVSVVVVATESAAAVGATVSRALATAKGHIEVVVVDAHMSDAESTRLLMAADSLPRTRVHRMAFDGTLEVARNIGASLTRGGVVVFLAELAWCQPGWDAPLAEAAGEHAAVQPLTLDNGGAVWSAGLHFLPDSSAVSLHRGLAGDAAEVRGVRTVDAVTAACLAVRADRFVAARGFDPLVMNHLTGGELSLRVADATGLAPACVGDSVVALRDPLEDDTRPQSRRRKGVRDNASFLHATWDGHTSRLPTRLEEDGFVLSGVLSTGVPADPVSPLLVRDRGERPLRWAIKIGAPDVVRRESWGDWHFARALSEALERLGHEVTIDCHEQWYRPTAHLDDVTVVLRGLTFYEVNPLHTNVIWVISHPDLVSVRELEPYDVVFGVSARWCQRVNRRAKRAAELLMQCTDDRRFHPENPDPIRRHELLAVANARGGKPPVSRPAVAAALEAGLTPAVYGLRWGELLPEGAWKGSYIPNEELAGVYAAAGAVLNDHWDDMREDGLISNRLFDLTASNARVISDHMPEIAEVFGDVVLTYTSSDEIPGLLETHLNETAERRKAREALGELVRREHTFDARARVLSDRVTALRGQASAAGS